TAVMAVLLVIAVVVCIAAAVIGSNPMLKVARALKASIRAAESNETVETVTTTLETGSVEIEADLKSLSASIFGLEIDAGVRLKSYFNTKNRSEIAADAAVLVEGKDLADVSFYTDGKSAAVSSEALFGKKAYGLKFDEVSKKFDDSIFGPDGEYSLGIDGEELSRILDLFGGLQDKKDSTKKLVEDTITDILTIAVKHAKTTSETGSVSAGDSEVKTTDVTMTLAEEKLRDFFLEAADYLRKNKDIREFLEKTFDEDSGIPYVSFDVDDLYDELDDLYDTVKETDRDELEDVFVKLVFHISKSNGQLIGLDMTADDDGDGVTINAVCAPDWKSPANFRLKYDDGYDLIDVRYTAEDAKDNYKGSLSVKNGSSEAASGSVKWDKTDGGFTVSLSSASPYDGETEEVFVLKGNLEKKGGTSVYSLKSLEVEGQAFRLNGIKVTVKDKDSMPVIKDFTDVLTMSEGDVEDLVEEIEGFFSDVVSETGGALGALLNLLF
ncbi:MAG: hypothetical protein IKY02_03600, partial [Lachnospiraceae bacterium]|nr:hypothetical protein [Lachnospiraceae bacterium]